MTNFLRKENHKKAKNSLKFQKFKNWKSQKDEKNRESLFTFNLGNADLPSFWRVFGEKKTLQKLKITKRRKNSWKFVYILAFFNLTNFSRKNLSKLKITKRRKNSWNFVYILASFNLTNFSRKKCFKIENHKKTKKFVKVCLHSSNLKQIFLRFDKFFEKTKNFRNWKSQKDEKIRESLFTF